jgi:hypothetical protein
MPTDTHADEARAPATTGVCEEGVSAPTTGVHEEGVSSRFHELTPGLVFDFGFTSHSRAFAHFPLAFLLSLSTIHTHSLGFVTRTLGFRMLSSRFALASMDSFRVIPNDGLVFLFILGFGEIELRGIDGIINGNRQSSAIVNNQW